MDESKSLMDPLKQVYTTYTLLYALIENAESLFLIEEWTIKGGGGGGGGML